jgi:hypothetical protein
MNPVLVEGSVEGDLEIDVFSFTPADFGLEAAGGGSDKIAKTALIFSDSIAHQKSSRTQVDSPFPCSLRSNDEMTLRVSGDDSSKDLRYLSPLSQHVDEQ